MNGGIEKNKNFFLKEVYSSTNCYTYALDLDHNPLTGELFNDKCGEDCQPGTLGLKKPAYNNGNEKQILSHVRQDLKRFGWKIRRCNINTKLQEGWYRVALCLEPEDSISWCGRDYHWYRQNADSSWSHKNGFRYPPSDIDSRGNRITNPEYCARGQYELFIGFFAVYKGNSMEH